jgi:hypothetical protein
MMTLGDAAVNDLAGGVVGVGDKVKRRRDADETEQGEHLVEQGAAVAIGPDQTFMDARGESHGEEAVRGVDEQADGLQGMPHNVFGLGVGVRLLMQQLDGRHFLAALRTLDAVADQDQPAVGARRCREQPQHHLGPQRREPVELDAGAMKVSEQPVIERGARRFNARTMLVTPSRSARTVMPATMVANHKNVLRRENAGRSNSIAFHHEPHSDDGRP